jgi:hypothetical protein
MVYCRDWISRQRETEGERGRRLNTTRKKTEKTRLLHSFRRLFRRFKLWYGLRVADLDDEVALANGVALLDEDALDLARNRGGDIGLCEGGGCREGEGSQQSTAAGRKGVRRSEKEGGKGGE